MSREALIHELRAMNRCKLDRALSGFSAEEREQVLVLVHPPAPPQPKAVPFDVLAGLSPWLLKAIDTDEARGCTKLTRATRAAVGAALGELAAAGPDLRKMPPRSARSPLARLLERRLGTPAR